MIWEIWATVSNRATPQEAKCARHRLGGLASARVFCTTGRRRPWKTPSSPTTDKARRPETALRRLSPKIYRIFSPFSLRCRCRSYARPLCCNETHGHYRRFSADVRRRGGSCVPLVPPSGRPRSRRSRGDEPGQQSQRLVAFQGLSCHTRLVLA